jgi:hypothetical protein
VAGRDCCGIFALEIAKNASGEIDDFAADRAMKSDERVDGVLTRKETTAIGAIGYGTAPGCGMAIAL